MFVPGSVLDSEHCRSWFCAKAARKLVMQTPPSAHLPLPENAGAIGEADLLLRHPVVRTADLDYANAHLTRVLAEHRLTFVRGERRLDFRHQLAGLGAVALNTLQFGADIEVDALRLPGCYLLQFMLAGSCRIIQAGHSYDMPAGSVAMINPCRPFLKFWSPGSRQLMIRIDRSLLEREFCAWTGRDEARPIEFDQSQAIAAETLWTLTNCVRMLCNDLRRAAPGVEHPFIRDRMLSALASTLLVSMPHK
jgi:hypothetical protein